MCIATSSVFRAGKEKNTHFNRRQKIFYSMNMLTRLLYSALLVGPVARRLDNAMLQINQYPLDKCYKTNHAMCWIVIYPLYSVIHLSKNLDLFFDFFKLILTVIHRVSNITILAGQAKPTFFKILLCFLRTYSLKNITIEALN